MPLEKKKSNIQHDECFISNKIVMGPCSFHMMIKQAVVQSDLPLRLFLLLFILCSEWYIHKGIH